MPYTVTHPIFLDCQVASNSGVFSAGTTTWTFSNARPYDYAVYVPTGEILTLTSNAAKTQFSVTGDYRGASGFTVLGVGYAFEMLFSPPFIRDERGNVELSSDLQLSNLTVHYKDTMAFDIEVYGEGYAAGNKSLKSTRFLNQSASAIGSFGLNVFGTKRVFVGERASNPETFVYIKSPPSLPLPCTITGAQWDGHVVEVARYGS